MSAATDVATKDHVESVVMREVQGLRAELSDKLNMQFRWLLGWPAIVTVGILLDLCGELSRATRVELAGKRWTLEERTEA